jgi:hypothetical protein
MAAGNHTPYDVAIPAGLIERCRRYTHEHDSIVLVVDLQDASEAESYRLVELACKELLPKLESSCIGCILLRRGFLQYPKTDQGALDSPAGVAALENFLRNGKQEAEHPGGLQAALVAALSISNMSPGRRKAILYFGNAVSYERSSREDEQYLEAARVYVRLSNYQKVRIDVITRDEGLPSVSRGFLQRLTKESGGACLGCGGDG